MVDISTQVRLGLFHDFFDVYPVDGRLAVPVALKKNLLAVGGKSGSDRGRVARMVLAERKLPPGDPQQDENIGRATVLAGAHEYGSIRIAPEVGELAGTRHQLVCILVGGAFAYRMQLRGIVREIEIEH